MTSLTRKPVRLLDLTKLTPGELAKLERDGFDTVRYDHTLRRIDFNVAANRTDQRQAIFDAGVISLE